MDSTTDERHRLDRLVYEDLREAARNNWPQTASDCMTGVVANALWPEGKRLSLPEVKASLARIRRRKGIVIETTVDCVHDVPPTYLLLSGPPFLGTR